jgi:hypothetical protein
VYKWAHQQVKTEIPAKRRTPYPRCKGRRFLKSKFLVVFTFGIGVLIFSPLSFAHHGYAAYDTDRKVTVKGTVTEWFWANPHCVLQLDVTDEHGQVVHWGAETENPTTMTRQGWTKESLKPGDQVTLAMVPVKNGKPIGRIIEVVLANGQKLAGRVNPATQVKPEDPSRQ